MGVHKGKECYSLSSYTAKWQANRLYTFKKAAYAVFFYVFKNVLNVCLCVNMCLFLLFIPLIYRKTPKTQHIYLKKVVSVSGLRFHTIPYSIQN